MIHWLQSLSENGFDVFIVVYLAVLHLTYHYLMRWHIKTQTDKIENMQKIIINVLSFMAEDNQEALEYIEFELQEEEE